MEFYPEISLLGIYSRELYTLIVAISFTITKNCKQLKYPLIDEWINIMWYVHIMEYSVSSVAQSCPTLWDPMPYSTPGFLVHHQLPELAQIHVHWVMAIQSLILSSPSPPALNHSQHQWNIIQLKKESNSDTRYNMEESSGHYAKWNKPVIKRQILYDSTYMKYLE